MMTVYVLFHQTNSGHSEESDGYVEAIYATRELADAARLAELRKAVADGEAVWIDPDTYEEGEDGNVDWEHDWTVEPHTVIER